MSISFEKFVDTYINRAVDFDGVAGVQCVDTAKIYCETVLNIKTGAWGNACKWFENFETNTTLSKNFTKIANTPAFVPQKGDIVIWKPTSGNNYCGHIAVASGEGNTTYFYSYDQNYGQKAMHKVNHSYSNFYGALRPKNQNSLKTETTTKKPTFKVGSTYTTNVNLIVRDSAGVNEFQKFTSQLTANGQKNALNQKYAVLKTGTKVTVQEVKTVDENIWLKIPSGWICGYYNNVKFVK